MKNPTKQTVYLPKATFPLSMRGEVGQLFYLEQGYFFTPEQLNKYTANVIKQTLETAAEKATYRHNGRMYQNAEGVYYHRNGIEVSKKSITNTFEETFKKFEI